MKIPGFTAEGNTSLPETVDPSWESVGDPRAPDILEYGALPSLSQMDDPHRVDGLVKLAQAMLNAALTTTPPLAADGNFGPLTRSAVRAFQSNRFLPVTDVIDTGTWFALALASPFPVLEQGARRPPMQGPPIAILQNLLNRAGMAPALTVDGIFTDETRSNLEAFQGDCGLLSTGSVTPETWVALAVVQQAESPIGTMRLTFSYDSEEWAAGGPIVRLVSWEDLEVTVPLSDDVDKSMEGFSGFWYELQDAQGQVLYRRSRHMPIALMSEVPDADEESGAMLSIPIDAPQGSFQLLAPILPRAQKIVLFSSPLDVTRLDEAATVIGVLDVA